MKRRLLNLFTALSLLLAVAAAGLWARSSWRPDERHVRNHRLIRRAGAGDGAVMLVWLNDAFDQGVNVRC